MAWNSYSCGGALSALYERVTVISEQRSYDACMCIAFCWTYTCDRPLFTSCGWSQNVLYTVLGMWNSQHIPGVFSEMHHSVAGIAAWVQPLGTLSAWIPILYAGVLSCGVAYTLQIVGQNGLNPTVASMIMSLESVFSVIAGWLILG